MQREKSVDERPNQFRPILVISVFPRPLPNIGERSMSNRSLSNASDVVRKVDNFDGGFDEEGVRDALLTTAAQKLAIVEVLWKPFPLIVILD